MSATHTADSITVAGPVLFASLELSWGVWKLAFTTGSGQSPRLRTIAARNTLGLMLEIADARRRFRLPDNAKVFTCYEAGRDGFWLARFLAHEGIENVVVDSASIEVSRHKRRAKSDRLDAMKLVSMLVRWHNGESRVWRTVRVPTVQDEDRRQLHRELIALKAQRTKHGNRIKGLFAGLGLKVGVDKNLPERLEHLRQWDGTPVPPGLGQRVLREFERCELVSRQINKVEAERTEQIRSDQSAEVEQVRRLLRLKGMGENGSWLLVREVFGWRQIRSRRELASLAGLAPTPYASGGIQREQGISKTGNRRVRWMMVELSWGWLRYQPRSALSRWFHHRFGQGNSRMRKVGIVALARKLLVALWKYLDRGELPEGAELADKKVLRLKRAS